MGVQVHEHKGVVIVVEDDLVVVIADGFVVDGLEVDGGKEMTATFVTGAFNTNRATSLSCSIIKFTLI